VDRRPASTIGRHARLDLVFGYRRGRTILKHSYAEPPFRVGRSLSMGAEAHVILVCCGPGLFGGDALSQHVRVEPGARVRLVSQSALQIHPRAAEGAAVLRSHYEVEADGDLDCFWDPVIPFAGARLDQRVDLQIADGGRLFWSDGFMTGRVGRGETWQFDDLGHELRLSIGGSLKYLERFRLTPRARGVDRSWMAGRATYMGTTLVHDGNATPVLAEHIHRHLGTFEHVTAGVDCVAPNLLVGRLLATRGPQFADARAAMRLREGPLPPCSASNGLRL
jgi:urease accessory protein